MKCKWCGMEIQDGYKFCINCGANVEQGQQNTSINNDQVQNNEQQFVAPSQSSEQKVNVWLVILSVIIPIAGLIIFLVKKDNDKKTANASGIAALISFGLDVIATILAVLMIFISFNFVVNTVEEGVNDYIENNENYYDYDNEDYYYVPSYGWNNYKFTINNTTLELPCSYNELSNLTTAEIPVTYENTYLKSGAYGFLNLIKNDNLVISLQVFNNEAIDVKYTDIMNKDVKVTYISQSQNQVENGAEVITFPGGLKVGQEKTKEELINLFGNPSFIQNETSVEIEKETYKYFEDSLSIYKYYQIEIVNGVINELILDYMY